MMMPWCWHRVVVVLGLAVSGVVLLALGKDTGGMSLITAAVALSVPTFHRHDPPPPPPTA